MNEQLASALASIIQLYNLNGKNAALNAIPKLTNAELKETIEQEISRLEVNHYLSKETLVFLRTLFKECEVRMK